MFLTGYSGILAASGAEGAYDFAQADAVNALNGAQFAVTPVMNPSAWIEVNPNIRSDIQSVAAAIPNLQGCADADDGRAAVEIAAIRNTHVMIGSNRTLDDYFADSVTNVGLKGEQAQNMLASQNAIMQDLRDLRDSISGVNIDEELADIMKFQHGYNAAARFVTVQDQLLDTLINRLGV
jgi:flagellar hook-associated protein 1 FlgK